MGRNSRKAHLIGGLAMGGKTSSNLVEHIQAAVLLIHGEKDRTAKDHPWGRLRREKGNDKLFINLAKRPLLLY